MDKLFRILLLIATITALAIIPILSGCDKQPEKTATDKPGQLYTCGMHPQVILDEPGICPICKNESYAY